MSRCTVATHVPGLVFERLAAPFPLKAIYFYEFKARPVLDVTAAAALLKPIYDRMADILYSNEPSPIMRIVGKSGSAFFDVPVRL